MKVETVHFCAPNDKGQRFVVCDVEVPGLGKVTISDCIAEETMRTVETQVIEALRNKLRIQTIGATGVDAAEGEKK